jgi:Putative peptidoglycan binding domain
MLKRLSSLFAAAVLAAALLTTSAEAKPLKRGAHGARVVQLQRALHLHGDGIFGPGTSRAVKRFQRRHHLHADGIVGPSTWRMIRRARGARRASSRAVASGGRPRVTGRGPSVRLAQRKLGLTPDGVFGPGTSRAVKRFQRRHGMVADGVVGPGTWTALGVRGHHPVLKRVGGGGGARARRSSVPSAIRRAIAAGNRIATFPYRYGGGHGTFNDSGYDCSGSMSYVLHHAGLLRRPLDSSQFESYGAPGPGRYITIYANPGHAYMVIRGRRYDTSGQSQTGSRWQPDNRSSAGYTVRHPPGF